MQRTTEPLAMPAATSPDVLTHVLRDGAQQLLAQVVEAEVGTWIEIDKQLDDDGTPWSEDRVPSCALPAWKDMVAPAGGLSGRAGRIRGGLGHATLVGMSNGDLLLATLHSRCGGRSRLVQL